MAPVIEALGSVIMVESSKISSLRFKKALRLAKSMNPDLKKVAKLLLEAKKLGSHEASYALATWYLHGNHFAENLKKGTSLLISAARHGVPEACYDLAVSYEKGIVVPQDFEKAFQLYMEATMRGDQDSRLEVARCLWHGIGTKKNRQLADLWGRLPKGHFKKISK